MCNEGLFCQIYYWRNLLIVSFETPKFPFRFPNQVSTERPLCTVPSSWSVPGCPICLLINVNTDYRRMMNRFHIIIKTQKFILLKCLINVKSRTRVVQLPSQSAPTILVLKTWVGLWPWIKSGPKHGPVKSKVKKTGSLLFKKRRGQTASFLFE